MKEQREPIVWRIALFVLVVSAIFWLGGTNARAFIGNDMLKPGTVEFEEYLSPDSEREVFRLISVSSVVIIVSYLATLASSILFLATCPYRLKEHGWPLMSAILFYVFVPVEIYTMVLDGKMTLQGIFHDRGQRGIPGAVCGTREGAGGCAGDRCSLLLHSDRARRFPAISKTSFPIS